MSKEEIGLAGEQLGGAAAQFLHVVHHMLPAVCLPQVDHRAALDAGQAVAQVVVGDNGKAAAAQVLGKGRVACAVFRHAVGDLDHAHDFLTHRRPLVDMDQGLSVAGREEVFRDDCHMQDLHNRCFYS